MSGEELNLTIRLKINIYIKKLFYNKIIMFLPFYYKRDCI